MSLLATACSDSSTQPSASILVDPTAVGVPATGVTGSTLTVKANVTWSASADSSALTITNGRTGDSNGTITYDVAPNASAASRTIHVTVTGTSTVGGTTQTAIGTTTLTQAGATVR
jgi:hypothetical protein